MTQVKVIMCGKPFVPPPSIEGRLGLKADDFLRECEVIAVHPNPLDPVEHFSLFVPSKKPTSHPTGLNELVKVTFGNTDNLGNCSLWVWNSFRPCVAKSARFAEASKYMSFPEYGNRHATWRYVAPITGEMSAVLCNRYGALELSTTTMNVDTINAIQAVFRPNGVMVLHVLNRAGELYTAEIKPDYVREGVLPQLRKIREGVNTLLTVPAPDGYKIIEGRDDGLYLEGRLILETKGTNVRHVGPATGIDRVFWRDSRGRTWGMHFHQGCKASDVVLVDGPRDAQLHFAGSVYQKEKGEHRGILMLSKISVAEDGRNWIHQPTFRRLPLEIAADPKIALTIM